MKHCDFLKQTSRFICLVILMNRGIAHANQVRGVSIEKNLKGYE